jgi:hypothetical protein
MQFAFKRHNTSEQIVIVVRERVLPDGVSGPIGNAVCTALRTGSDYLEILLLAHSKAEDPGAALKHGVRSSCWLV